MLCPPEGGQDQSLQFRLLLRAASCTGRGRAALDAQSRFLKAPRSAQFWPHQAAANALSEEVSAGDAGEMGLYLSRVAC